MGEVVYTLAQECHVSLLSKLAYDRKKRDRHLLESSDVPVRSRLLFSKYIPHDAFLCRHETREISSYILSRMAESYRRNVMNEKEPHQRITQETREINFDDTYDKMEFN